MYVPFYANKEQYEMFIDSRKIEIKSMQEAIIEAEKRIKDKEFYKN